MTAHTETQAMCERLEAWTDEDPTLFDDAAALLTRQQEEIERLEDKVADLRLGQRAEIQRADTHRDALAMLYMATEGAIEETPDPHRVFFDDGFVIDGRAADEWHKFMMLIQRVCLPAKREAENALDAALQAKP